MSEGLTITADGTATFEVHLYKDEEEDELLVTCFAGFFPHPGSLNTASIEGASNVPGSTLLRDLVTGNPKHHTVLKFYASGSPAPRSF